MKGFILSLLILFTLQNSLNAQWEIIAPKPMHELLTDIYMFNESSGIVGSLEGTVIKTSDGFNTIQKIPTPWTNITNFHFFNDHYGLALADTGVNKNIFIKTTDGGISWSPLSSVDNFLNVRIGKYYFPDSLHGWFMDYAQSTIYNSSDGGNSWNILKKHPLWYLKDIFLLDSLHGWIGRSNGILYKTTDGGTTWDSIAVQSGYRIKCVSFSNPYTGIILMEKNSYPFDRRFRRTTDGGTTWNSLPYASINYYFDRMTYEDPKITLYNGNGITYSNDNGVSWNTIGMPSPSNYFYYNSSVRFFWLTENILFAAGGTGIIKKTTDIGVIWTNIGTLPGGNKYINFTNDGWAYTAPYYKSSDEGNSWLYSNITMPVFVSDFHFIDHLHGFVSSNNYLYQTTDGGLTYLEKLQFSQDDAVDGIYFISDSIGWLNHGIYNPAPQQWYCQLYKTTNGGANWNVTSFSGWELFFLKFVNDSIGFAREGDPNNPEENNAWRTSNGGATWQINNFAKCSALYFFDSQRGVAVINGTVIKTYNGGLSYFNIAYIPSPITSLVFIDSLNGWAGSYNGVYRTTTGGSSWYLELSAINVQDLKIHNNNLFALSYRAVIYKRNLQEFVPVEMSSFTVAAEGKKVVLNWSTVTETNNKGFYIERKKAGSSFTELGFVAGKGTLTSIQNYSFLDLPEPGIYIYRLKQVDYNGASKYLKEVQVEISPTHFTLYQNYPNPFNPVTTIKYSVPLKEHVVIKLYDVLGYNA